MTKGHKLDREQSCCVEEENIGELGLLTKKL